MHCRRVQRFIFLFADGQVAGTLRRWRSAAISRSARMRPGVGGRRAAALPAAAGLSARLCSRPSPLAAARPPRRPAVRGPGRKRWRVSARNPGRWRHLVALAVLLSGAAATAQADGPFQPLRASRRRPSRTATRRSGTTVVVGLGLLVAALSRHRGASQRACSSAGPAGSGRDRELPGRARSGAGLRRAAGASGAGLPRPRTASSPRRSASPTCPAC